MENQENSKVIFLEKDKIEAFGQTITYFCAIFIVCYELRKHLFLHNIILQTLIGTGVVALTMSWFRTVFKENLLLFPDSITKVYVGSNGEITISAKNGQLNTFLPGTVFTIKSNSIRLYGNTTREGEGYVTFVLRITAVLPEEFEFFRQTVAAKVKAQEDTKCVL